MYSDSEYVEVVKDSFDFSDTNISRCTQYFLKHI
jgi:hypothetical protein